MNYPVHQKWEDLETDIAVTLAISFSAPWDAKGLVPLLRLFLAQ
jgi:hypothetical protein